MKQNDEQMDGLKIVESEPYLRLNLIEVLLVICDPLSKFGKPV